MLDILQGLCKGLPLAGLLVIGSVQGLLPAGDGLKLDEQVVETVDHKSVGFIETDEAHFGYKVVEAVQPCPLH